MVQQKYILKQNGIFIHFKFSDLLLPKAYGLSKICKDNLSFRLIVSSVNIAYGLELFLQKITSNSVPHQNGHVHNSFDLYCEFSGIMLEFGNYFLLGCCPSIHQHIPVQLAMESYLTDGIHRHILRFQKKNLFQRLLIYFILFYLFYFLLFYV